MISSWRWILLSLTKRRLRVDVTADFSYLNECFREDVSRVFYEMHSNTRKGN